MRRFAAVITTLLLLAGAAFAQSAPEGNWAGAIEIPGAPLEVSVTLTQTPTGWEGTIDIPAQGAFGLPLTDVAVWGQDVTFAIAGVPGAPTFTGTLATTDGQDTIQGAFSQSGQQFPFALTRPEAQEGGGAAPAQTTYEDPAGRFSLQVPAGWTTTEEAGGLRVTSTEGGIHVFLIVVPDIVVTPENPSGGPEEAIAQAWTVVRPELSFEPVEVLTPPSQPGVDHTLLVNYDLGDPNVIHQALAQTVGSDVHLMLIEAQLGELQRRNSQLQIVASSYTITAVEEVDLTGVEPRRVTEVVAELEEFIGFAMEGFSVPGAAVAIVQDGEVVYQRAFGEVEAGSGEPLTTITQMMIGSTTKTLTSLLIAQLVDDGTITWDTPVVSVLPQFAVADPELTETITFRNLLCACTGVPRRDLELLFNSAELTAEAIVESLESFEFFTEFGEAFQYSNQLVATAGFAAAAANGAEFGELMAGYEAMLAERVTQPIGMLDTTFSFEEVRARGQHATPHQQAFTSGAYEPIDLSHEEMLIPVAPAGALWSTLEDMGRYLQTVMARGVTPDGERIVSEDNLLVTWEPQVPVSATESYGLGWMVGEYRGLRWIYHGGNTVGFTSEFTFLPDVDVGIVVLTNAQGSNTFNGLVELRLIELLFDQPAEAIAQAEFAIELSQSSLEQARERLQERVQREDAEPFLGTYANAALGTITLEWDEDQLIMDAGEFRTQIRPYLDHLGEFDTHFTYGGAITGLPVELRLGEDGARSVVIGQAGAAYVFEAVE